MFNMFNKKKKIKSNLFNFIFLKRKLNLKKLLIISAFALIVVGISIFSAYSFPGSSGGVIIDNNYEIIAFTDVGPHTWAVPDGVTEVDVLVVGGGGGGGLVRGGGGGGGGVIYEESVIITPSEQYSIVVGAGGTGGVRSSSHSTSGGDSSAFGFIAIGGGRGARWNSGTGAAEVGGSGGGGAGHTAHSGANGTINQGNDGGDGLATNAAGGGGGASENGNDGIDSDGGAGGDGLYFGDLFGNQYGDNGYFGGGGGGHSDSGSRSNGGIGGGGAGAVGSSGETANGIDGMLNTGGGGGGGGYDSSSTAGSGGSGIVLIRYKKTSNLQVSSLNSGLVAHYTLDQNRYNPVTGRVTDNTPYSNHGFANNISFTSDRHSSSNKAMVFNGSDSGVTIDDFPLIFEGSVSLSAWVYYNDDSRGIIFGNYNTFNDINFEKHTSRRLRLYWNRGEVNAYSHDNAITLNEWNHIVIIRNKEDDQVEFWVNGELNRIYEESAGSDISNVSRTFRIGRDSRTGLTVTNGNIDDLRIYNRALSEQEISQLYNSYKPKVIPSLQAGLVLDMPLTSTYTKSSTPGSEIMTDRTPYSNDGQNYNAIFNENNNALEFSYSLSNRVQSDFKTEDYFNNNNEFTLSFWTKLTSQSTERSGLVNMNKYYTESTPGGFGVMLNQSNGFSPHISTNTNTYSLHSSSVTINEWQHVLITYKNNDFKFYQNSQFIDSRYAEWIVNTQPLLIGRGSQGGWTRTSDAVISNIRIYNRALSAEEVELLYARGR